MNIQIFADGKPFVNAEVDFATLMKIVAGATTDSKVTARSTPATVEQMEAVLSSIDPRSAQFLREIASDPQGSILYSRMEEIFGIDEWSAFSRSFGRGITRAFRSALQQKTAKLFWWDENKWDDDDDETHLVFVDGPALAALRQIG